MSGITPLIDTLLHQVLGRQGEVSLQRALNQAVKPIPPGDGPRALMGDANLDGRATTAPLGDLKRLPQPLDGGRTPTRGDAPSPSPVSTQTHFSPAARTIADVLLRFPAPPTVMRPDAPLVSSSEAPGPSLIATRLEASIRDSGLFYESHLKRWFQGEGSRQQLLSEPQMQAGPRPLTPVSPPSLGLLATAPSTATSLAPLVTPSAQSTGQAGSFILPNTTLIAITSEIGSGVRQGASGAVIGGSVLNGNVLNSNALNSAPNAPGAPQLLATQTTAGAFSASPMSTVVQETQDRQARLEVSHAREVAELNASRPARDVVHESLQSLVRQQLEMLVTPTIRWEGDIWAGIFMALVINLPVREKEQGEESEASESKDGWRSDMQLDVPNLGAFSASIWLYRNTLSIDFTTENMQAYDRLNAGLSALEQRLSALDLKKVQLRVRHFEAESADGNAW